MKSNSTPQPSFPCPSCGFVVFDEPAGSYNICPVCGWEDDHVQLANPTLRGGANQESLLENQERILKRLPIDLREYASFRRDPNWRPLLERDYAGKIQDIKDGMDYFHAAGKESPAYYWQNDT